MKIKSKIPFLIITAVVVLGAIVVDTQGLMGNFVANKELNESEFDTQLAKTTAMILGDDLNKYEKTCVSEAYLEKGQTVYHDKFLCYLIKTGIVETQDPNNPPPGWNGIQLADWLSGSTNTQLKNRALDRMGKGYKYAYKKITGKDVKVSTNGKSPYTDVALENWYGESLMILIKMDIIKEPTPYTGAAIGITDPLKKKEWGKWMRNYYESLKSAK